MRMRFHRLILVLVMDQGCKLCFGVKSFKMDLMGYYHLLLKFVLGFLDNLQVWTYIFTNPYQLVRNIKYSWWVFAKFKF